MRSLSIALLLGASSVAMLSHIAFAPTDDGGGGTGGAIDNSDADLAPLLAEVQDTESWEEKAEAFFAGVVAKLVGLTEPPPAGQPDITADQLKTKIAALASELTDKTGAFKTALASAATSTGVGASITSLSPTSGAEAGGDSIVITGTGFTGALAVNFGSTAAASFNVDSDTQITAVSPAGTGSVAVAVQGPINLSANTGSFSYTPAAPADTGVQQQVGS